MNERFWTMLRDDMEVCDANGDRVGKISKIYQPVAVTSAASASSEPGGTAYMKVDPGFFSFQGDLYIPTDAISDVSGDQVILSTDKDHLDAMGWNHKPDFLQD